MELLTSLIGVLVWHLAMLNSFSLYTGTYAQSWIAPRAVLLSRMHLLGVSAAFTAAIALYGGWQAGFAEVGLAVAISMILLDTFLVYLAFKRHGSRG